MQSRSNNHYRDRKYKNILNVNNIIPIMATRSKIDINIVFIFVK